MLQLTTQGGGTLQTNASARFEIFPRELKITMFGAWRIPNELIFYCFRALTLETYPRLKKAQAAEFRLFMEKSKIHCTFS